MTIYKIKQRKNSDVVACRVACKGYQRQHSVPVFVVFVDVRKQHVRDGAVKYFNQFVSLQMIRGGYFVKAVAAFTRRHLLPMPAIAEQGAGDTMPRYDALQQEIDDFACSSGGMNLYFC